MHTLSRWLMPVLALGWLAAASAAAPPSAATLEAIAGRLKGAKASDISATPIPGIFEFRKGAQLAYVTEDGRYAFAGDLYQLSDNNNLSDVRRRELRRSLVDALPESSMLVFAPAKPAKYTITVFTDVDCGYCRELHRQMAEYNRLGIRVRYLAFPRTGPKTESWTKAEQVWCAADRKAALTRAKQGQNLTGAVCASNPVAQEYELGKSIGIDGTPGIITDTGGLFPGYYPPATMLQELQDDALAAAEAAGPANSNQ